MNLKRGNAFPKPNQFSLASVTVFILKGFSIFFIMFLFRRPKTRISPRVSVYSTFHRILSASNVSDLPRNSPPKTWTFSLPTKYTSEHRTRDHTATRISRQDTLAFYHLFSRLCVPLASLILACSSFLLSYVLF